MNKFLWGSATASYQCEGGWNEGNRGETQWDNFSHHSALNINHVNGDVASDFYHKYEEDIKLLADGGQNTFRFSIAWSRIIPDGVGEINPAGIEFYNKVIDTCLKYHLVPNVTLFHYDLPKPIYDIGGWENRKTITYFVRYAQICFKYFGDRVPLWSTINEPNYYSYCSYIVGNYPPNKKLDFNSFCKSGYHVLLASARVVREYKKLNLPGRIGIVIDTSNVQTKRSDDLSMKAARKADLFYNKWVTDTVCKGYFPQQLFTLTKDSGIDLSFVKKADKPIFMSGIVDFLGLNIYSRAFIKHYTEGKTEVFMNNKGKNSKVKEGIKIKDWFETDYDPDIPRTKWGSELYPKCMYDELMDIKKNYGNILIYITENGIGEYETADKTGYVVDDERIEIMKKYICYMLKAKKEGVNVQGYYAWSTMDLYSWVNGYEKRYGLIRVDFDHDLKRIPKKSYFWYKNLILQNTEEG